VRRVQVSWGLVWVVCMPFGGGNSQLRLGVDVGLLYEDDVEVSRVSIIDKTKGNVFGCSAVLLQYPYFGAGVLRHGEGQGMRQL